MENYRIEFTKEHIGLFNKILESVYNRFCWSYHIAKMHKHVTMCDFNFNAMTEVATLMDEIYSQIMIQHGGKNI